MLLSPEIHVRKTADLARKLKRPDIYRWLVTNGYFPESYVLPPCFTVTKHPAYGKIYYPHTKKKFAPKISEYQEVHFPKTELTDRTFGIIEPELHSEIAYTIALNWKSILNALFKKSNKVYSYSFPIPLNSKKPGRIGGLRSGRMIYEFIEMAENDIAAVAHKYKYLLTADVKNFYSSIYTHSIAWAVHGKKVIRKPKNRHIYSYFGNRLDKLFQYANDTCTNGIPIGPVVSDLIGELILASVDNLISKSIPADVLVVRFKDDYRILAHTESQGKAVIKTLQAGLKEYRLELNDDKTKIHSLPNGIFRPWVSQYHVANPRPKNRYGYKRFREVYLSVLKIDADNPGCGVIDRFLADLVDKEYDLRIEISARSLPKILSLLLMLADRRIKAFPKVLAIIESILKTPFGIDHEDAIVSHLDAYLNSLAEREQDDRYLIAWICYFIRANGMEGRLSKTHRFIDPIVRAVYTSRSGIFSHSKDFKIFSGVKSVASKVQMLEYLDVFKPQ